MMSLLTTVTTLIPRRASDNALVIGAVALATLAGAWTIQGLGYAACDLCYEERYAYYASVLLAAIAFALAASGSGQTLTRAIFWLVALLFAANVVLAIYHSGVEAHVWRGPTACTGSIAGAAKGESLLDQLATAKVVKVVNCDVVEIRIFGLSLANWNVFVSGAISLFAARAALSRG